MAYSNSPPKSPRFYCELRARVAFFERRKDFRHGNFQFWFSTKHLIKTDASVLWFYLTFYTRWCHLIGHMVTIICSWSLSNYLREGKDAWELLFIRFEPLWRKAGRTQPWRFIDVRDRLLALTCLALRTALVSLGCELGFGLARFELAASLALKLHFSYMLSSFFMCFHIRLKRDWTRNICSIEDIQTACSTCVITKNDSK